MKKIDTKNSRLVAILLTLVCFTFFAKQAYGQVENKSQKEEVQQQLKALFPHLSSIEIEDSKIAGVFQFWLGADLHYVRLLDGHIMLGEVFDTERKVSLAQEAKSKKVIELIGDIDSKDMIIFAAENEQRIVNVFTDVDCGYCRKLHREVGELNDAGITVRYIAFPAYSRDIKKHISVWCSEDPLKAMTAAKQGNSLPEQNCDNSVEETLRLGVSLGFRGTPHIVYDNGQIIGGYREFGQIIQDLDLGS